MKKINFILFLIFYAGVLQATNIKIDVGDNVELSATHYPVTDSKASVLLFHQCNRDQEMWAPVVKLLNANGLDAMTVDFRGYGESASKEFNLDSDDNYLKSNNYIKSDAGKIFKKWLLVTQKANKRAIIGASCGGGQASWLAAQNENIDAIILFSPSLRDYWFDPVNWDKLHARRQLPILGISSIEDQNATGAVERILNSNQAMFSELKRYNGRLHGEPLFEHDPNLPMKMVTWLNKALGLK